MSSAQKPSVTSSFRIFMLHGRDAGHGLDRARVDLVELGDEVEDAVQLMLEPRLLILGDGDAGEMGDAADGGAID